MPSLETEGWLHTSLQRDLIVRPENWVVVTQVGVGCCSASGGRIALLPGACWAHRPSKMTKLGASLVPHVRVVTRAMTMGSRDQ